MGQFFLLLWKDWILLRRNKLWTTIELILPCLLLAPFSYILVKYSDTSYSRAVDHDPFTLTGRLQDAPMLLPIGNNCKKNAVLAYTSKGSANKDIAKELMSKVQDRFNNSIEIKNLPDEDKLLETLRKDMPRLGTFCPFNLYVGGVVFETVDVAKKKLKYRILFGKFKGDTWNMRETHTHLYGEWMRPSFNRRSYIESGYLSFQHAIETSFISLMHAGFVDFPIILRELPEPKFYINHVLLFFSWLPSIWQFVALLLTIHIAREISAENLVLKPYLSAMGLSTFVYYAAHIFVGLLKFLVVFSVGVIPLAIIIPFVSPAVLLIFVFLFGIASIVFGALVGSMFSNSNTATQAIMIFTVAGTVVGSKMQPPPENIIGRALFCLNMNGAFSLAIESMKEYIQREMVLDMFSIFNESTIRFSMGCTLLMLIFDIFWMAALTLLVDRIRASGFSLMTMIKTRMKSRKESSSSSSPESDNTVTDWCEVDEARDAAKADIIVNDLVKIYSTGETAVNGLSLRAVQGQVSILLGHNGAGKSTTFSSIAGIIKPTYGSIKICDYDVSEDAKMTKKFIGLCPQTNPLYDQLTVGEHLYLVHGLKGANREEFQEEMQRLLKDVNLDFKEKEKSKNLSGGMKRKLCVCMALIGDSKVILLDEPSAGMDPGARQDVQKLVEKEKANRTVLLTTHYMDEAERLGDWVFVMSHGKLAASGTTQYLKQKFGTGYLLTVVMHHNGDKKRMAELLTSVCQHFVKGAERGEMHGLQVEIILPESQKSSFVTLFKALEAIQEKKFDSVTLATVPSELKEQLARLVMTCFGLSLNSLEQVFIIIGEKYEKALENKMGNNSKQNNYKLLLDSQGREPEKSGAIKVFAQILAILRKKNLYMIRNPFQFLAQIIISLVMLFLISAFLADSDEEKYFSPSDLEPAKALMRFDDSSFPNQIKHFESLVTKYPGFDIRRYNMNKLLSSIVQETIGVVPPIVFGMTVSGNGVEVLYNGRYHHVLPSLVTMVNLARFSGQSSSEAHIQSGVTLFNKPADKDEIPMADFLLLPIVVFVFATFTSTFAVFMVEERECQFAHQQWLTGISPITFYSGSLLFDALCYAFICLIFGFVFHSINWMTSHLGLVVFFLFLYFGSSIAFVYAVSFFFKSSSKANAVICLMQIVLTVVAFALMIVVFKILYQNDVLETVFTYVFLFFVPLFAMGYSLFHISTAPGATFAELIEWKLCGRNAFMMVAFGIASFALFIVLQFKSVRKSISLCCSTKNTANNAPPPLPADLPICPSVEEEKKRVHKEKTGKCALVINDLTKTFGGYTAVNELCLAVDRRECFGLLGVNGAGKTTTFNILTGQSFATSGEATIGGRDVTELVAIGYCPQYDALLPDMTGRETLEILAQMHGFDHYKEKVELVLKCVGMEGNANKRIRYCSGGQKRKISVGVALLSPTQLIILDEPTAGVDPQARREIWELLLWCRENSKSAIVLTSHSMDECEALCSRIAVLNKGQVIAIGTSQDLKSLYGNNYTMILTLNNDEQREDIVKRVAEKIPKSVFKTAETNRTLNLKWQIPKKKDDSWSAKFEMVQNLAKELKVKDFILTQSSLEETFLRLAGINE